MRAFAELRDPWALVVAALAGLVAYAATVPWPYALGAVFAVMFVRVLAGVLVPAPGVPSRALPVRPSDPILPAGGTGERLTPAEVKVAELVFEGLRDKEIAARLVVSVSTVHKHLEHIRDKLDVHSRGQIAKWWSEQHIRSRDTH